MQDENPPVYKDITRTTLLILYTWVKKGLSLDAIAKELHKDKRDLIIAHKIAQKKGITKSIMFEYNYQQKRTSRLPR